MADNQQKLDAIRALANEIADQGNADVFVFNYEVLPPVDLMFTTAIAARDNRRKISYFC